MIEVNIKTEGNWYENVKV